MQARMKGSFTKGTMLRIAADAIGVNLALLLAVTARFWGMLWLRDGTAAGALPMEIYASSIDAYVHSASILTPLILIVFYLSGFYTRGRAYLGRYKSLLILQAVTVAYLIFGATTYLLFNFTDGFPRSVFILGWIFSVAVAEGLRMWSKMWKRTMWLEAKSTGRPKTASLKNILVIGGAGYMGSVLVRKLLSRGYRVTVMDALMYGDDSIRDLMEHPRFDLIRGDLRNVESVIRSLQYVDAVAHLGGLVGDPACDLDEKLTLEVNLAANYLVAEAARGLGVQRLVFASTCSVYGGANQTLDERSPLNPASLYARTKMDSETAILRLAERDGFAPVILRFGTLFGLSPRPRFDLVVNVLAAKAITEGVITIHGGDQWRPFIHVDDAAEAIIKALKAPAEVVGGEVFNVGSDSQNHTISQVGELVQRLVPEAAVIREERADSGANYRVSFAKIRSQLGFEPTHSVSDGIREIKAVIENGVIPDYLEVQYSNHKAMAQNHMLLGVREISMSPLLGKEAAR